MLGGGRPFLVELTNPNIVSKLVTPEMVADAAAHLHSRHNLVKINNLRLVGKNHAAKMRMCEVEKRKHYRCVVWTSQPLTSEAIVTALEANNICGGTELHQNTPLRVLHRRTLMVRKRQIYSAKVVRHINAQTFVLDVIAAAGTYIKEFVHGDNGRTVPNVAQLLGCEADILQLDVAGIDLKSSY
jgi:tRNA pseudouridine synthase 10